MSVLNEYLCDVCGRAISRVEVAGVAVPVLVSVAMGTSPAFGLTFTPARASLPQYVRDTLALPNAARRDYCVECFAKAFDLKLTPPEPAPTKA